MEFITILGLVAATLTTSAFIPQLIKIWKSKSAKDVSLQMLITFCIGVSLWLIYGIYLQSLPVILANLLTLIFNLIILWLKIKYEWDNILLTLKKPVTASAFSAERLLFTPATPDIDAILTIFAFPNEYSVGITSLGYQVVWATLAMRSDLQVSRLFTDIHEQLPRSP